jgi:hypothetical protein
MEIVRMCRKPELEIQIIKSGKKKYEITQTLRWHPSKLSTILNGTYKPSSMEKEDLCKVLGCQIAEAFPPRRRELNHA